MPTRERTLREADKRAEALLRGRLTPAQRDDVNRTGWFNVRDAIGKLWRVNAGLGVHRTIYQNLTDDSGIGRTMFPFDGVLPGPDVACAMLLYFGDQHRTYQVHQEACRDRARSVPPDDPIVKEHYESFGEDLGGGKPR